MSSLSRWVGKSKLKNVRQNTGGHQLEWWENPKSQVRSHTQGAFIITISERARSYNQNVALPETKNFTEVARALSLSGNNTTSAVKRKGGLRALHLCKLVHKYSWFTSTERVKKATQNNMLANKTKRWSNKSAMTSQKPKPLVSINRLRKQTPKTATYILREKNRKNDKILSYQTLLVINWKFSRHVQSFWKATSGKKLKKLKKAYKARFYPFYWNSANVRFYFHSNPPKSNFTFIDSESIPVLWGCSISAS